MTSIEQHPSDELQLLVEGRLPLERRAQLEDHLSKCGRCRQELDALEQVRAKLRTELPWLAVPSDVRARILEAVAAEAGVSDAPRGSVRLSRRVFVASVAGGAAAAGVAALLGRLRSADAIASAARDFDAFVSGDLTLDLTTSVPLELEAHFRESDLGFQARVFDFGMMGYQLAGGGVHRVGGDPSALFAYRGQAGEGLLCQMYRGSLADLPPADSERAANGVSFRLYGRGSLTLVFWQEGPLVCVLVSDAEQGAAVDLAAAKAIRV